MTSSCSLCSSPRSRRHYYCLELLLRSVFISSYFIMCHSNQQTPAQTEEITIINKSPGNQDVNQSYEAREHAAQGWLQLTLIVLFASVVSAIIVKLLMYLRRRYCSKKQNNGQQYLQPLALTGPNVPPLQAPAWPQSAATFPTDHQQAAALLNWLPMLAAQSANSNQPSPFNQPPPYSPRIQVLEQPRQPQIDCMDRLERLERLQLDSAERPPAPRQRQATAPPAAAAQENINARAWERITSPSSNSSV